VISVDTNILFTACNVMAEGHDAARRFLQSHQQNQHLVISELVLTEMYTLLRNPTVMGNKPYSPHDAVEVIQKFRHHPRWRLVENASVMEELWPLAAKANFAGRKIYDTRIALTLLHHGVEAFATANVSDFQDVGFKKVWNPLLDDFGAG
jgi:uncharacterized protein